MAANPKNDPVGPPVRPYNRRRELRLLDSHVCGCGAKQGELHDLYCQYEHCPFCGGQLMSCGCCYKPFYPDYNDDVDDKFQPVVPMHGLPKSVYEHGLPRDKEIEWRRLLNEKGRIPFIFWPNLCGRCGEIWPQMFSVPSEDWARYVSPRNRGKMLCWKCYCWIVEKIDKGNPK